MTLRPIESGCAEKEAWISTVNISESPGHNLSFLFSFNYKSTLFCDPDVQIRDIHIAITVL